MSAPKTTRKRGEPPVYVAHHICPRPEDVRQEDIIRLGRLIHELLHRQPKDTPDRAAQEGEGVR